MATKGEGRGYKQRTFMATDDQHKYIRKLAFERNITVSQLIRQALAEHTKNEVFENEGGK